MAKRADESPRDTPDVIPPDPGDYVPLTRARAALRRLLDDREFCKTTAAVDVAYALGALEEDVDGGQASVAKAREAKDEALHRTIEIARLFVELVPQWLKMLGMFHDVSHGPTVGGVPAGETPRQCMATPSNLNVWVCCQCLAKASPGTPVAMITEGETCPVCQHTRCDSGPIPFAG